MVFQETLLVRDFGIIRLAHVSVTVTTDISTEKSRGKRPENAGSPGEMNIDAEIMKGLAASFVL